MSFDGIVTYAAAKEFRDRLSMGKIEKIYQPQPEQLLFIIHTKQGKPVSYTHLIASFFRFMV